MSGVANAVGETVGVKAARAVTSGAPVRLILFKNWLALIVMAPGSAYSLPAK